MIFSVIPWSSILGASTGPADYYVEHETSAEPFAWELNWWFPQLAMLFIFASTVFVFREHMNRLEVAGCSMIVAGIVLLVLLP